VTQNWCGKCETKKTIYMQRCQIFKNNYSLKLCMQYQKKFVHQCSSNFTFKFEIGIRRKKKTSKARFFIAEFFFSKARI
jgi:hypothetical protein